MADKAKSGKKTAKFGRGGRGPSNCGTYRTSNKHYIHHLRRILQSQGHGAAMAYVAKMEIPQTLLVRAIANRKPNRRPDGQQSKFYD